MPRFQCWCTFCTKSRYINIYFEEQFWIQPVKGAGQEAKIENSWQKQKSKKHLLHHPPPPPLYPSNTFTLFRPTLFPADVQDTFQGAFHFHFPLKNFSCLWFTADTDASDHSLESLKHFLCWSFFLSQTLISRRSSYSDRCLSMSSLIGSWACCHKVYNSL